MSGSAPLVFAGDIGEELRGRCVRVVGVVVAAVRRGERLRLVVNDGTGEVVVIVSGEAVSDPVRAGACVLVTGRVVRSRPGALIVAESVRCLDAWSEVVVRVARLLSERSL